MRIFLHCGFHKTGTTSFQHYMMENQDHWPEGFAAMTRAMPLVRALRQRIHEYYQWPNALTAFASRATAQAVKRRIESLGADTVIFSMEGVSGMVPDEKDRASVYPNSNFGLTCLYEALAEHEPTILFSTREKSAWIKSVYGHRVRVRGLGMDYETFSSRAKYVSMDWDSLIATTTKGIDAPVVVRAMEDDLHEGGMPGWHFLELAGLGDEARKDWESVGRRQRGLNESEIEFAQKAWVRALPGAIRRRVVKRAAGMR